MSKTYSKNRKLNNNGSTLVMTILTIAFISLLASVILAASVGNVIMKKIDYNSKDAFYTAESVLDEIKVGVGKDSMEAMAGAYENVLSNLIVTDGALDYMMENDEANEKLKQLFMQNMTTKLTNGNVDFNSISDKRDDNTDTTLTYAKSYLEKFINKIEPDADGNQNKYAIIKSIESITFIKDYNGIKNQIIVNNVVIDYKAKKANETYFANVTVDLNIEYPNMIVDFSASKRLNDFKEFAFIAYNDVIVKTPIDNKNVTANVNAGIYAWNNISVNSTLGVSELKVGPFINAEGTTLASNVVAGNNLELTGSESSATDPGNVAKLTLSTTNLWVNNIETKQQPGLLNKDITAGVEILINSDCKTFVADDLNIDGKNSVITIGGEYYGYSYDGVSTENQHKQSSAIIVKGAGSKLNLGTDAVTLKKLIIGGHSYIDYDRYDSAIVDYMTGESLSFEVDQELYLVPSQYIGLNYEQSVANPMPKDVWIALQQAVTNTAATPGTNDDVKLIDMTGFFANDEGLLASTPYEVKEIGSDMIYVYLNFKDRASAATYIQGVLNNKAPELEAKLDKYIGELLSADVMASGAVSIADGVEMYTSGVLMETNGTSVDLTYGGDISQAELGVNAIDYKNRYRILKYLLSPLSFTNNGSRYVVNDIEGALTELKEYELQVEDMPVSADEENRTMALDNIVDWTMLETHNLEYNVDNPTKILAATSYGMALTKVAIDGDYVIPDDIYGGIVIATGNVEVNHDFTGLIIAQGNIIVTADATVKTNDAMVESLITYEYTYTDGSAPDSAVKFKNYFQAYKSTGANGSEDVKIESLDYDDMISLDNWRKYDDSAE